jgi:regulator of sigma E protease
MEAITGTFNLLVGYVLPFLCVLTVVVFVHESGHFWMGRLFGTRIETFSIGFGRALLSWTDRKGTAWKIGWLPLGGYVKFWGDEDATSLPDAERLALLKRDPEARVCFHFKPLWQKALIVAAGPFANFIFAAIVFAILYGTLGFDRIPLTVARVEAGSPAAAAGILPGDVVDRADGVQLDNFKDLVMAVMLSDGDPMTLGVKRGDQQLDFALTPQRVDEVDPFGNKLQSYRLGIGRGDNSTIERVYLDPVSAVTKGAHDVVVTIRYSLKVIGGMITGRRSVSELRGPVGTAQQVGQMATLGLTALVALAASLSVSIGLINLFPIPMLDGGHLLFYGIEAVRRRPMGERAQEYALRIGLALVLSLMLFATWNDLMRIFWS